MLRSNTKPINGFLLEVSDFSALQPWHDDFDLYTQVNGAVLDYEEQYSNNVIIGVNEDDVHLYQIFRDTLNVAPYQYSETLIGASIIFHTNTRQLVIKTDISGSEPVYCYHQGDTFRVTDRIDNFPRYLQCSVDLVGIYSLIAIGTSIGTSTSLCKVKQSNALQTIQYDSKSGNLASTTRKDLQSDPETNPESVTDAIIYRLHKILKDAPDSALIRSAGLDSRALMSDISYIKQIYTHSDFPSRELNIAFNLGRTTNSPKSVMPLTCSKYGANANNEMLTRIGQCLFPHWYHATKHISERTQLPTTSGMFVELFCGHYGINITRGSGRKRRTLKSFLLPSVYDKIADLEAISRLSQLLASRFKLLPWFFPKHIHFQNILNRCNDDLNDCLFHYNNTGTSGIRVGTIFNLKKMVFFTNISII